MNDEMKVLIQWASGSILPVLVKKSSKPSDLSYLLRFACSPYEEIIFQHHGTSLKPDVTLECQMIKENDIINAIIAQKLLNETNRINVKIKSIVCEAAKVSDWKINAIEREIRLYSTANEPTSEEEDDYFDLSNFDLNIGQNRKVTTLSSDPLPVFWSKARPKQPDMFDTRVPVKLESIEEAGQFLEKQGWSSWMW